MDRYTRWSALLEVLAQEERLTVEDAARRLAVSEATIRRDFDALAKQRRLVRLRGVAVHQRGAVAANLFAGAAPVSPPHARRIAAAVADLLRPGSVVGLTGNAMTGALARAIGIRFGEGHDSAKSPVNKEESPATGLTVVTSDLSVASELARRPALKVVTTGGVLAAHSTRLTGPLVGMLLQGVTLDTVVVAAHAADPEFGVTADDEMDADSAALMIERTRRVVVAVTSGDLNRAAFARVCETSGVDTLVTDRDAAPATVERFAHRGVRVVTV